jgi:hypothetical protein
MEGMIRTSLRAITYRGHDERMDDDALDELVERGGRTPEEWATLTPNQRLLVALEAQAAIREEMPAWMWHRAREVCPDPDSAP